MGNGGAAGGVYHHLLPALVCALGSQALNKTVSAKTYWQGYVT